MRASMRPFSGMSKTSRGGNRCLSALEDTDHSIHP
jgi:hypothetical protein